MNQIFDFKKPFTGLSGSGLYYCKMFVEDSNGQLIFSSAGKGKGAVARVTFDQHQKTEKVERTDDYFAAALFSEEKRKI